MSSNIHHSTNTTNMWQGQKSFFFFLLSGKRPYTLCTDDWHLMKHKWLVIEHKQWEACLGLWSTGFLNSYNAATKKLLWSLSKSWPTDHGLAAGTVMNLWTEANFSPKPAILWHFESLPSLWARTICSHGNCERKEQTQCLLLAEFDSVLAIEFLQVLGL